MMLAFAAEFFCGASRNDQEDFQDMNQITRRGTNWHNLQINDMQDQWNQGERLRSIEFSDGPRNCIAIRKPGPVWRGGYVYMMHASICRTDGAAVQAQDVAYVLSSLQARTYDPVGNLRNANDQTTYDPPQTRDKPTTDTAVWGDSGAGSRPAGWTTQYTRPRQRWLRTSAAGVRYRRNLAVRSSIAE